MTIKRIHRRYLMLCAKRVLIAISSFALIVSSIEIIKIYLLFSIISTNARIVDNIQQFTTYIIYSMCVYNGYIQFFV